MTTSKHTSLKPRTNAILAAVWFCAAAVLLLMFSAPRCWIAIVAGGAVGIVCGALQDRAIRTNARAFLDADSAMAVRRALTAGTQGRWAIRLPWALAAALAVLGLSGPVQGFAPVMFGGYFAMMFAREVVSFRALVWLQSYEPPRTTEVTNL
jgi:hypothetical protein